MPVEQCTVCGQFVKAAEQEGGICDDCLTRLEEERHIEERKAIERSFGDPSNEHERQIEELKAIQRSTIDPSYQQKELAAPRGTTGLPLWP